MAETTTTQPSPSSAPDTSLLDAYDPSVGALRIHVGPPPLPEEGNSAEQPPPPAPGRGAADPATRHLYAGGLMSGEVTGPDEFAKFIAPDNPQEVAPQFPSIKHIIDGSIDALAGSGAALTPDAMHDARNNLTNLWALSGDNQAGLQVQIENDPLMQEALGQPGAISPEPAQPEEKPKPEPEENVFATLLHGLIQPLIGPEVSPEALAQAQKEHPEASPEEAQEIAQSTANSKEGAYDRLNRVAHIFTGGMAGPVPGGALGAGPAILGRFKVPDTVAPVVADIEHRFNVMQGRQWAQRGTILKNMQAPDLKGVIGDTAKQTRIRDDIEGRLIDPRHARSDETNEFLRAIKPLTEAEHDLGQKISALLTPEEAEKLGYSIADLKSVDQGYAHRIEDSARTRRQASILAKGQTPVNLAEGGFHRSLSTYAPGLKARNWYVFDHVTAAGDRIRTKAFRGMHSKAIIVKNKDGKIVSAYVTDPATGLKWNVRPAVTKEIEANSKLKFHPNYMANLLTNVDNLKAVHEHLKFLKEIVPDLEKEGLFVKKPLMGGPPARADGMAEVNLPQMKGWAEPHVAAVLNRFWNDAQLNNFRKVLHAINTALVQAMFITPIPHMANVATSWVVGRGLQWVNPRGYWPMLKDGARALKAVRTMNSDWVRVVRAGAGLASPRTELSNYHAVLMEKLFNEQRANPRLWGSFARSIGVTKLDELIQAEMKWSHKTLWRANDVFLMQRIFELERRGLPLEKAIERAERDIPTYRLPTHIMGSAKLSDLLSDNSMVMFGRYHYGLLRSLSLMVRDLIGPAATMRERLDAAGKWAVLGALTYIWPQSLRPSGPEAITNAARNVWTGGEQKWHSFMSSLQGVGAAWDIADTIRSGKDSLGRPIWRGDTQQKIEHVIETAAGYTYPGQVLLQVLKHPQGPEAGLEQALGGLANLKISQPVRKKHHHPSSNHMVNDNDVIDRWVRAHLRKAGLQ